MNSIVAPFRAVFSLVAVALALVVVTPSDALAYVDPGTGSYLFQLAAAGLLAGIYMMRHYWHTLTAALRGKPSPAQYEARVSRPDDVE